MPILRCPPVERACLILRSDVERGEPQLPGPETSAKPIVDSVPRRSASQPNLPVLALVRPLPCP